MQKIERLQYVEHVLSLESEDSASEYQQKLVSSIRQQQLLKEDEEMNRKLFAMPTDSAVIDMINAKQPVKAIRGMLSYV